MLQNERVTSTVTTSHLSQSAEIRQGREEGKAKNRKDRQNPDDITEASESRCAGTFKKKKILAYLCKLINSPFGLGYQLPFELSIFHL